MIDESTGLGALVARHLREDRVAWLTTVTPGGSPLPAPVWFWWDGNDGVFVFSLPDTARTRNIEANPKVSLNFAGDGSGGDIVILSGRATIEAGGSADQVKPYVKKYGWGFERLRVTPAAVRAALLGADPDQAHEGARAQVIRLAGPEDLETVTRLLVGFRDWWGSATPTDEMFHATARRTPARPQHRVPAGRRAGLAQLRYRLSVWTGVEDCWLEDLYVSDDARGSGLGRALVEACVERARARGCRRIELDVNESNEHAIRLYVKCGFSVEPKPPGRTLFLGAKLH